MPNAATQTTIDFLGWLYGYDPAKYVYLYASRDKVVAGEPKKEHRHFYYHDIAKELQSDTWEESVESKFNLFVCTSRTKNKYQNQKGENVAGHKQEYAADLPAIWFDIDGCKKLFDPERGAPIMTGEEFYGDLRIQEADVSAWVRSSEHGVHGYYKLAMPVEIDGDTAKFDERVRPLLMDVAWYYGGDLDVCTLSRVMRLPGSHNRKAEYRKPWPVTSQIYPDRAQHTLKALRERFGKVTLESVPRIVAYAIVKLIQEVWDKGETRHNTALALAGSLRQAGVDRGSARTLFKELTRTLHDDPSDGQRMSEVDTTYTKGVDEPISTIRSTHKEIAGALESILTFWVELKKKYAKYRHGMDWTPEAFDPVAAVERTPGNRPFWTQDGQTWFKDKDGDARVAANFTLRVTRHIVKHADRSITAMALITKVGAAPLEIELTAARENSWSKFSGTTPMVAGIGFRAPQMWTDFVIQVDEEGRDAPLMRETPHYGVLGGPKSRVVFLPGQEREDWVCPLDVEKHDTALSGALTLEISEADRKEYLRGLLKHLPNYHLAAYWLPALGWFCACPLTQLLREDVRFGKGFPTLMVTGSAGAGKSTLTMQVLGAHFGCRPSRSFASTPRSLFTVKRSLGTNNVCPFLLDEYRPEDDGKTSALCGIIRGLWDGEMPSESGTADGGVRLDELKSPMCVVGEAIYNDPATLERTLSVHVDGAWVRTMQLESGDKAVALQEAEKWLHNEGRWQGFLGTMLLEYLSAHLGEMDALIGEAVEKITATCKLRSPRKRKGFVAAYAGLLLLKRVCEAHDVPWPLKEKAILRALYGADEAAGVKAEMSDPATKSLFQMTDAAIVDGIRRHATHEDTLYFRTPKPLGPDDPWVLAGKAKEGDVTVLFQKSRWFKVLDGETTASSPASLFTDRGKLDVLEKNAEGTYPIVLDLASPKTGRVGLIEVNATRLGSLLGIDVAAWLPANEG